DARDQEPRHGHEAGLHHDHHSDSAEVVGRKNQKPRDFPDVSSPPLGLVPGGALELKRGRMAGKRGMNDERRALESPVVSAANSESVRVSARRVGSMPAAVAARRTTSSGRPSPAPRAFASIFRRWAKAARSTVSKRRGTALEMSGSCNQHSCCTVKLPFGA